MKNAPEWASTYIGVPFVDKGRCRGGCDCWGLVRLVVLERRNVNLPMYSVSESDHTRVCGEIVSAHANGEWEKVSGEPTELDVAEMSMPVVTQNGWEFLPLHVGVCVGNGWVLHTERATGAVIGNYKRDPALARRIIAFWRHKSLAR